MKRKILLLAFFAVLLCSCGSVSSFESPNNLRNLSGTLYLTNGKTIDGRLTIQMGNLFSSDVKIYADGDKDAMKFNIGEVQGYRLRGNYYALKEIRGGINFGKRYSFMKQITKDASRINLYESINKVEETSRVNGSNVSRSRYEPEYYMQLLSENGDDVYALTSSRFVPNFDEKMSRMVGDCPSLAQKIAAKEKGYFYAQISLSSEKRVEVLLNIIDEYNRCGKAGL